MFKIRRFSYTHTFFTLPALSILIIDRTRALAFGRKINAYYSADDGNLYFILFIYLFLLGTYIHYKYILEKKTIQSGSFTLFGLFIYFTRLIFTLKYIFVVGNVTNRRYINCAK